MLLKRGLIRLWIALSALWLIGVLSLGWIIGSDIFNQISKANARVDDLRAGRFAPTVKFIGVAEEKPTICIAPNFQSANQSGRIVDPFDPYEDLIPGARYCDLPDSLKSLTRWGNLSHQEMKELITLSVRRAKSRNEPFDPEVDLARKGYPAESVGLKKDDVKAFLIAKEQEWRNEKVMSLGGGFVLVGLLPPLVLLALGFIAAWVIAGFRSNPKI
jgi:hypothetical protein